MTSATAENTRMGLRQATFAGRRRKRTAGPRIETNCCRERNNGRSPVASRRVDGLVDLLDLRRRHSLLYQGYVCPEFVPQVLPSPRSRFAGALPVIHVPSYDPHRRPLHRD